MTCLSSDGCRPDRLRRCVDLDTLRCRNRDDEEDDDANGESADGESGDEESSDSDSDNGDEDDDSKLSLCCITENYASC